MEIVDALRRLEEEIAAACAAAGRNRSEITLVAVTKTHPPEAIRAAYVAGIRQVGENRAQELLAKKPMLEDLALVWHMVGSLQTNKVKSVLPHIGLLHSLDRFDLLRSIAGHARTGARVPVLIQVNTTGEPSKSGVTPAALDALLDAVCSEPAVRIRGFMTIGPLGGSEADNRRAFALLRQLRDRSAARHPDEEFGLLSMGMSDDFREAIAEGSTLLRVGSRIFGARS